MRIAWVVDGRLDQVSGGYLYDRLVIDHLKRHGVDVDVVSLPTGSYGTRLAQGLRSDVAERIGASGPQLVVEDELSHPGLLRVGRRLARRQPGLLRVGLVHHLRSSEPRSPLANLVYRRIERRYLRSLDAFIFNSRATRGTVQRLGLRSAPSIVAVPGADRLKPSFTAEAIRRRAVTPGPLRALFVGQMIPRKGLMMLVEAVALLPSGSVRLEIAGSSEADSGYARRVRRRVDVLQLDRAVRFLGVLDSQGLAQAMAEAHVLAVPSSYEGYGMAYLEGMGYGLPAIAGAGGGAKEFLRHEENGFLLTDGDPAGLAVILSSLHSDRARLTRLGISARSTYLAHPTWETTGDAILTFLAGLIPRA